MALPPALPEHLDRCSINEANRLYDTHENELLIITGWNGTAVTAGTTADTAVLIENALAPTTTRYIPVTTTALDR